MASNLTRFDPFGEFVNGGAAPRHGSILAARCGWRKALSANLIGY